MQPDPTSPLDLEALKALCDAAPPGPWTAHDDGLVWPERMGDPVSGSEQLADAAFIAAARESVPALLAALAEAQRERDDARDALIVVQCDDPGHAERELMRPVVEKAQVWKAARSATRLDPDRCKIASAALAAAVDTYETQEGTDGR